MKLRKEITVSKYVLDRIEEAGVQNFSGLVENLLMDWIRDQSYAMRECSTCHSEFSDKLETCPHCKGRTWTTKFISKFPKVEVKE